MEAHPEAHPGVEAHPGSFQANPGAVEAPPGAMEAPPGAVEAHPGALEAHPAAVGAHPLISEPGSGFNLNPGFWWPKIGKNVQLKKKFFDQKLQFTYP
jgi:hypothetical protein